MCLFPDSRPKKDFRVTVSRFHQNRDPTSTLNRSQTSNGTWATSLPPESTNKRIISDDSPKIKVACDRKIKIWDMDEYEQ